MKSLSISLAARLLPLLFNTQGKQRLFILIYHRILRAPDPLLPDEPTIVEFDWQMRLLRDHFSPLPLVDAVKRLQAGDLPANTVCVTFDDGYADNALNALPILRKYGIPATVFVSTGFLNGGRMWNDSIIETVRSCRNEKLDLRELELDCYGLGSPAQRVVAIDSIIRRIRHFDPMVRQELVKQIETRAESLPNDLMLTDAQIRTLALNEISIGAHTVNHPILSSVSNETAKWEIQNSKSYLEEVLQREVETFAYPNGKPDVDYGREHRDLVDELGFKLAVSTHWGVSTNQSDTFQLPRFTPWDRQELKFAIRLLANYRLVDPLIANTH